MKKEAKLMVKHHEAKKEIVISLEEEIKRSRKEKIRTLIKKQMA